MQKENFLEIIIWGRPLITLRFNGNYSSPEITVRRELQFAENYIRQK